MASTSSRKLLQLHIHDSGPQYVDMGCISKGMLLGFGISRTVRISEIQLSTLWPIKPATIPPKDIEKTRRVCALTELIFIIGCKKKRLLVQAPASLKLEVKIILILSTATFNHGTF